MQPPGDHQVQHQEQGFRVQGRGPRRRGVEYENDALADAPQPQQRPALNTLDPRDRRAQQQRTRNPQMLQHLPNHPRLQRRQIRRDVW
jgi:hypothetical protein